MKGIQIIKKKVEFAPVKYLFNIEKGTLQSLKNIPGKYPFLTGSETWKTHKDYSHDCEALAFVMGAAGSLGRTHHIKGKFIASDLCFILTPKKEHEKNIDLEFYKIYFNMMRQSIVKELSTGTSKIAINLNNFSNYQIPFPDLNFQTISKTKINFANKNILELDSLLEGNLNFITKLREAILSEAVQGKLVEQDPKDEPASILLKKIKSEKEKLIKEGKIKKQKPLTPISDEEKPYELPKGWEWVRLGDLCSKIGSGSTPRGGKGVYKLSGIKFIRSQNVYDEELALENIVYIDKLTHERMHGTRVFPNDLLLNITGGSIGRCALVPSDFDEANVSQHVTILRTLSLLQKEFIHKIIISPYFQNYIMATQNGANREGLAKKNMELMLVPLPPLPEQARIVEKVDKLMAYCAELEKQVKENQLNSEKLMGAVLKESFEK